MVRDSRRVINEHSQIIDGLRVKVQMLKEETGLVAVAAVEARADLSDGTIDPREAECSLVEEQRATLERARASIFQYKKTPNFKLDSERMSRVPYKYEYLVALAHLWVSHSKLKIKEDPYATLPEDDDVPMEVEVPFDDINPLAT
ncbi:hypothetical protein B296_00004126 [Ensete ventricosum]|uniref:Uncharacterized protein n=1 Tax=Ensete ventricosum TaxID=4639 RepID=A0A427BBR5_ENSVE|nr:hypothetical protein B296_00004126 [Ensete ventricosum]